MKKGVSNASRMILLLLTVVALSACSIRKTAVNALGSAMSGGGGGVFASDDDPELIKEALPFGIKTYESLLEVSPEHQGLLLSTAQAYATYAYLLSIRAEQIEFDDRRQARALRRRANKHFLRARNYAVRGLDARHQGFSELLTSDINAALAMTDEGSIGFLYWAGATWVGALAASFDDLNLIAELPIAEALMRRVIELDEGYDRGAAHEFFVSFEGLTPNGSAAAARRHYDRALALSNGRKASVFLALAEAVSVPEQNVAEFRRLIERALAVDPDAVPNLRLVNTLARNRALLLRDRIADLFLDVDGNGDTE